MKQVYNKIFFISLLVIGLSSWNVVMAVCPVCVVAVGAGLGLSEWLGIDDIISSIWIGAFLVSLTWWTIAEMRKRKWGFKFDLPVIALSYYLLTLVPMYYGGIIGHPLNTLFNVDKIILGTFLGTVITILANWFNIYLKKRNNGKVFFPYQKVVIPVTVLLLLSIIFHLLLIYKIT